MVIPELLAAVGALDEDEQRMLAQSLSQLTDDDDVQLTEDQKDLVRSRREELQADPSIGLDLNQVHARVRKLLVE